MADKDIRIGVLRGRENSFPDAFIEKVAAMDRGVSAEYVQLGGTKLKEDVPYRVVVDRMSHEVPYYEVYLKMAALQGTYCINNTFWRSADDKFFGYAVAEKLGIGAPKTVVLPNKSYVEDVTAESLRNLWPVDFAGLLDYVGAPCIMKPAFGGGWKNVNKIHSIDELMEKYNDSGTLTLMLQEFISWDTFIRVPTVGQKWARAIRYDPAPLAQGGYDQDYGALPGKLRDTAEELRRVAVELRGLLGDVGDLTADAGPGTPLGNVEAAARTTAAAAAGEGRALADHVALRLLQLIGVVFLAAIGYRVVASRVTPRPEARGATSEKD